MSIGALLEWADGRGNVLLSPAPLLRGDEAVDGLMAERRVLPVLSTGAGQALVTVLLNPTKATMTGQIEIAGQAAVPYRVAAGGAFVHSVPADGRAVLTGRGIIRASEGNAPAAYAIQTGLRRDGSLRSVHTVSSSQEGTLFWGPVNTYPDVLHQDSPA